MRRLTVYLAVLIVAAALAAPVMLEMGASRGHSQSAGKLEVAAAQQNAKFIRELTWTFGSKQQRGWYLYLPLIKRLINTKNDGPSSDFARAVSRWQSKSGIKPTGVLDEETLYAMIKTWQEARLKNRATAPADQLLTAPISDFYDPTRAIELRQVT